MNVLLVLNFNPAVEEDMVDYLLGLSDVSGFTSYAARGHGQHAALSIAEQVSGRRNRIQVEMLLDEEALDTVLEGLAVEVGTDIHWWVTTVLRSGSVQRN